MNEPAPKPQNPVAVLRHELDGMEAQFKAALPAHIPVERFSRVVMTAIQNNPDLMAADRRSLWNSAMRAAQDGLLPDGRDGAMVIFNTKEKRDGKDVWVKKAQWMPMVFGIMKKARNSGQISAIGAGVVYEGDSFRNWIDDSGEHLHYEPCDNPNVELVRRVFAYAKLKDNSLVVETLTPAEIERIRAVSRTKDNGPWVQWWSEMAKKSAIRRLSKRLPMSSDLDDLIRRDDDLYDFNAAREAAGHAAPSLTSRLDQLAKLPPGKPVLRAIDHDDPPPASADAGRPSLGPDNDTTEDRPAPQASTDNVPASDPLEKTASSPTPAPDSGGGAVTPSSATVPGTPEYAAWLKGKIAAYKNDPKRAPAPTEAEYVAHAEAWIDAATSFEDSNKRWSDDKNLRNGCNVSGEARAVLQDKLTQKQASLAASE